MICLSVWLAAKRRQQVNLPSRSRPPGERKPWKQSVISVACEKLLHFGRATQAPFGIGLGIAAQIIDAGASADSGQHISQFTATGASVPLTPIHMRSYREPIS